MTAYREFLGVLTRELDGYGLKYQVEQGGKHKKLRIEFFQPKFLVIPSTPSDRRGVKNSLSRLRRMIREAAMAPAAAHPYCQPIQYASA